MKARYRKNIFVSHIGLDESLALQLKKWIELVFPDKCEVFVSASFKSIAPGEQWAEELRRALTSSDLLLIICTRKSINSGWILFEAGSIWGSNTPIIPISCDDPLELPVLLGEKQAIKFSRPDFSATLIDSLKKKLKLSTGFRNYNKMTQRLRQAYKSAKTDAQILDRIKQVRVSKDLKKTERTAPYLAAHFGLNISDIENRMAELVRKGYVKPSGGITGKYYSLTSKSERLLL
jgi:TIR domain